MSARRDPNRSMQAWLRRLGILRWELEISKAKEVVYQKAQILIWSIQMLKEAKILWSSRVKLTGGSIMSIMSKRVADRTNVQLIRKTPEIRLADGQIIKGAMTKPLKTLIKRISVIRGVASIPSGGKKSLHFFWKNPSTFLEKSLHIS